MLEGAAGLVAWLGASLVVLGDGRRGLALGVALAAAGLAGIAWQVAGPVAAVALGVGGQVAAAGRLRSGSRGWQIMPAGSTPRTVLCVAAGLLALWFALGVTTGPGAGLRFVAFVCMVLATARILWFDDQPAELSAACVLALAVGSVSADVWPCLAGGLVAVGAGWLPERRQHAG